MARRDVRVFGVGLVLALSVALVLAETLQMSGPALELISFDTFYSSPDGSDVLTKMPKMSAQLPAMIQGFESDYMAAVRAKLKASDAELKL